MNEDSTNIQEYLTALDQVKYEGQLLWHIFSSFLLTHTIFVAFLLHSSFGATTFFNYRIGSFVAGFVGLLLCLPWAGSYLRSSAYYIFRMAQAREKEPQNWDLIRNKGELFSAGEEVNIGNEPYEISGLAKVLRTKRSVPLLIIVFAFVYLFVIIASGPWWKVTASS